MEFIFRLEFPPNDFDPNLIDFIKRCLDKN